MRACCGGSALRHRARIKVTLHLRPLGCKPQKKPDLQSPKEAIQATVMLIALRTVRAMVTVMTVLPARVNHCMAA